MIPNMLNRLSIKSIFSNTIYNRGFNYYKQSRVRNLFYDKGSDTWEAQVDGSDLYDVDIKIKDDNIFKSSCDCPAYDTFGQCKHIVAVLLAISEELEDRAKGKIPTVVRPNQVTQPRKQREPDITSKIIDIFSNNPELTHKGNTSLNSQPLKVEYIIKIDSHVYDKELLSIEMKIGHQRTYVVKSVKDLLKHVDQQKEMFFTKNFTYDPQTHYFEQNDLDVIQQLMVIYKNEIFFKSQNRWGWQFNTSNDKGLGIPPLYADELFRLLQHTNWVFDPRYDSPKKLEWVEDELPFTFNLDKNEQTFELDLKFFSNTDFLSEYGYVIATTKMYKLTKPQQKIIDEMTALQFKEQLPINREQIDSFLSHVVPNLKKIGKLEISEQVSNDIVNPPLLAKLYLDQVEDRLTAKIEYHYHDIMIDPLKDDMPEIDTNQILIRDIEKEQTIMNHIEQAAFKFNGHELYLNDEEQIFTFLYDFMPHLEDDLDIYMTNQVKQFLIEEQNLPNVRIEFDSSENFLEVNFDIANIDDAEIHNILHSIQEKKRYYRLPDGSFVPLEDESFSSISDLIDELNINPDSFKDGKVSLPAYRGLQVADIMSKQKNPKYNKAFKQLIQDIKHPDDSEVPLPTTLKADMRDYQNVGFQWLHALSTYHFGGILADDMGLGKTVQSIAFLLSEREKSGTDKPALIVCPSSLVFNWKSEFEKFAPSLTIQVISGSKLERSSMFEKLDDVDVIVTSYPLVRQDTKAYAELEISTLILDEAQAIKNHTTKIANAIYSIQAEKRYALSGTPIENSLDELWSIFNVLLPGFFPNKKQFNQLPQEQISRMVRPFILRRLKKDVLKELPDKIEAVHTSELTKEQKQLYLGYLDKIKGEAMNAIASEGFHKSRMKILAGLTRLRQLCCHPALFIENYEGESGKLIQLMEMVENALENGQRMLIFSQFSSMLQIIREQLLADGKDVFYLDGQTPSQSRVEMAERFNNGEKDIFLISLKAGGTGLNLTGADTVILYDLWWNPAIEEQAAGRAHRIGQKKVVQVFRLITKGTIEEKIYALQQKKKELIENIIQPGETMLSSLNEDEILEILNM